MSSMDRTGGLAWSVGMFLLSKGEACGMILLLLLMVILFFGISTLLFIGKGDFLIAGLNAMNEEEKEKIDTFKLNRFMGKMMYVISGGMLLLFLYRFYNSSLVLALALLLLVVPTIFIAIFTFNFDRFRK